MTSSNSTISVAVDAQIEIDGGSSYCFGKFIDKTTIEQVQNNKGSICGTAHIPKHLIQPGREMVAFTLLMDLTADVLDAVLPHMSVQAAVGTVFTCSEAVTSFPIVVNKVAANHTYTGCRIARWAIRAQRGSMPATIQLDCIAATETDAGANTFTPEVTPSSIYTFPAAVFKYATVAYPVDRVAIVCDMGLFKQWNNSSTLTDAVVTVQETFLAVSTPYVASSKAIYWDNRNAATDRAMQLTLTTGSDILIFNMPTGRFVSKSPDIVNKLSEIRLPQTWQATSDTDGTPALPNAWNFNHTNA